MAMNMVMVIARFGFTLVCNAAAAGFAAAGAGAGIAATAAAEGVAVAAVEAVAAGAVCGTADFGGSADIPTVVRSSVSIVADKSL
jgi:hypothetical protein